MEQFHNEPSRLHVVKMGLILSLITAAHVFSATVFMVLLGISLGVRLVRREGGRELLLRYGVVVFIAVTIQSYYCWNVTTMVRSCPVNLWLPPGSRAFLPIEQVCLSSWAQ